MASPGLSVSEVMTRRAAQFEFVDDGVNGLITRPESADLAAAVRRISDDETLRARLRAGAVATAAEFTWERAHAQLDSAIEITMGGPR